MALTVPVIVANLNATRAAGGFPFLGINFDRLALGVALAITQWGVSQPQNLALGGLATGSLGTGVVLGQVIVPPNIAAMQAGLTSAGMVGPLSVSLAVVMALGLSQAFSTSAQYTGPSGLVGIGADVSKIVVANTGTLVPIMQASLVAQLGPGPASPMMSSGLSIGTTNLLLLGTGAGAITGQPTGGPGTGLTTSVVM